KALTSENCGFVLCTKCGPCRTARKQFSKGLRSKTGVQQHPKNTQKRLFRQTEPPRGWHEMPEGAAFRSRETHNDIASNKKERRYADAGDNQKGKPHPLPAAGKGAP